jgi:pimeloyl-ACP methyl ester carboxylesterase
MSIVRDIVLRNEQGAVVTKVLTVHGDQDSIVPVESAWDFHSQIGKNTKLRQDDDHQIVIIPEADHSFLTEPEAKVQYNAMK